MENIRDIFILQDNFYPYFERGDAVIVDPTTRCNINIGDYCLFTAKGKTYIEKYTPNKQDVLIGKILTLIKTLAPASY